ncbi:MAG: hypothetical protein IJB32_05280, partial [Clostridia bacterium]|nr:hypothetical protein [Clostridia bacterium]
MKHTFRTIFSVLLAAVMSLTVFASCDGLPFDDLDGPTEQIDVNRTQVVVGMYDGGIGTQWINSAKKKFEELYKDVSFETGKTGVQIVVHKTTSLSGSGVGALLPTIDDEIIFCEGADYYNLVNMGSLLDITDLLTEDLSSMGDVGTIEDNIPDTYKNFLNVNGKYYGLPFYEGTYGLFYDISLFESYGFYYDNNNTLIKQGGTIDAAAGLFTTKAGEEIILGTGPDGLNNTYDDGLPRTYDEFFALCDYIYKKGVTPISWPGQYIFHMDNLLKALAVDDAGFKQDQLFFNFSGTATDLVEMDGNGKVVYENGNIKTYSQEINNSNGYLL